MALTYVRAHHFLRYGVWRRVVAILDVFHLLPPIAAILILALLYNVGQLHEIYYSYFEEPISAARFLYAIVGLSLLSGCLYACHYWLSVIRQSIIFSTYTRPNIGIDFRALRRWGGFVWALSPWLGIAAGLLAANQDISKSQSQLAYALKLLGAGETSSSGSNYLPMTAILAIIVGLIVSFLILYLRNSRVAFAILFASAIGAMASAAIIPFFETDQVSLYRTLGPIATLSISAIFVLSLATLLALLSQKSKLPALSLSMVAIAIIALTNVSFGAAMLFSSILAALFALIALLADLRWSFWIMALLSVLAFFAYHRDAVYTWSRQTDPNMSAKFPRAPNITPDAVAQTFDDWLGKRNVAAAADGTRYPVFVIAVEGGGIYAAAAASAFLAKLQDDAPNFAKHVFAISGVSGGAIGASVFQALSRTLDSSDPPGNCASELGSPSTGKLERKVAEIMQDDHFSPLVGAIIPDLLGEPMGRAQALEASFLDSTMPVDRLASCRLIDWYVNHWSAIGGPALVLNTTSADTGYRVAFAPFFLKSRSDETLYSFLDTDLSKVFIGNEEQNVAGAGAAPPPVAGIAQSPTPPPAPDPSSTLRPEQLAPTSAGPAKTFPSSVSSAGAETVPLMFAAVASARFPLILPPFTIRLNPESKGAPGTRWNFVDGGYADNSGAATALDLYQTLSNELTAKGLKNSVDIKMIVLSSDDPAPEFSSVKGTSFTNTVAPIYAVLNVRAGLGNQAVTRACDYFQQLATMQPKPASSPQTLPQTADVSQADTASQQCGDENGEPWEIKTVKLQDAAYGLPLGWKISKASYRVITEMVAHNDYCKTILSSKVSADADVQKDAEKGAKDLRANSCAIMNIERLLAAFSSN